ncbi:hypothetical protein BN7_472 [Wickerhamomyces ciferrii]|uniref:Uncharacterized protein n=1 Tax=Wickerhamomyces ciferrii (strain ATCC 14091 / BCRC 22168 / CBS 111 / JCM 3599 / NBRC 0793 / NRRL Y-1031 F-60-10) TaxID=1206466 RepID=K0KIF3_WICCF|nr:uncharacterized protein BN7_472 [Wickerhamomyces ciferrii]CCH40938.1 hypothetical protein BN7_472 [Wickerhamomyces ciferrii]
MTVTKNNTNGANTQGASISKPKTPNNDDPLNDPVRQKLLEDTAKKITEILRGHTLPTVYDPYKGHPDPEWQRWKDAFLPDYKLHKKYLFSIYIEGEKTIRNVIENGLIFPDLPKLEKLSTIYYTIIKGISLIDEDIQDKFIQSEADGKIQIIKDYKCSMCFKSLFEAEKLVDYKDEYSLNIKEPNHKCDINDIMNTFPNDQVKILKDYKTKEPDFDDYDNPYIDGYDCDDDNEYMKFNGLCLTDTFTKTELWNIYKQLDSNVEFFKKFLILTKRREALTDHCIKTLIKPMGSIFRIHVMFDVSHSNQKSKIEGIAAEFSIFILQSCGMIVHDDLKILSSKLGFKRIIFRPKFLYKSYADRVLKLFKKDKSALEKELKASGLHLRKSQRTNEILE